ncbi:ComF family protein [Candidatus Giovannonibacteria bacterium]|nr:ComF family protein [Candidatus Giovannonibacteria bacterium]
MERLIHTYVARVLSLIFPERCLGCGKSNIFLCKNCIGQTRKENSEKISVLYADKIYSWGIYENETLRTALRRFKYHKTLSLAEIFSDMLIDSIGPGVISFQNTLIIPVPASKMRKRQRGYNQAEILAEKFCQKTSLPYAPKILIKIKGTPSQTSLSREERLINVKDSFAIKNPELIKNKKIILVDDILTTGATISECAKVLKNAGAEEVIGLVVAI